MALHALLVVRGQPLSSPPHPPPQASTWSAVDAALVSADIAVANFGLHWRDHGALALQLGRLADRLDAFTAARRASRRGCASARLAILVQTPPQHFPSTDGSGDFFRRPWLHVWRLKKALGRDPCERITTLHGPGWRNDVLEAVARRRPRVKILRIHHLLMPLHRLHINGECTHWCWHSELWKPAVDAFARLVVGPHPTGRVVNNCTAFG